MSFGSGGFSGFGQQNQQQPSTGFGGFGSTTNNTTSGFGSTGTNAFGSTSNTAGGGGGLFGGTSGSGFGSTGGGFGSNTGGGFGAKPAFGSTTTTGGGGLFGSTSLTTTAGTSGFGSGGGFGSTASSTPFGGGTSLFGGNKPATTFGSGTGTGTTTGTGTSLFGGGTTSGFGSGTSGTGFGAAANPGIGTNVGDPPGTAGVPFSPFLEKESTSNTQNSYNNILFMDAYKKWSAEELRLADYNQGRRHGTTGGTGAFGVSSGFGTGGFGSTSQSTGFGTGGTSTGTGGLFGSSQPATTGFGQTTSGTSGFGTGGGGLFGAKPATGGGLFGGTATSQPAQSGGLFGSTTGGFGTSGTTGTGFGSGTAGTGLFGGGTTTQNKPAGTGFSFGTATQGTSGFGSTGTTGGFGSGTGTTGTGLFGGATQSSGTGLFGGGTQTGTGTGFGSTGFGAQQQQPQQQQQTGTSLFGQPKPAGGLFGGATTTPSTGGLFGGGTSSTTPFGASTTQQQPGGLFGAKPAGTTGGLFGTGTTTQTGTTGGGLFGNLTGGTQTQQQPQQSSLFGQPQQKPSLFGTTTTPAAGGGLFGAQPAQQQGGLFGSTLTQQPQQAPALGTSIFGAPQGAQATPQSLTTSIADVSAYGTPSLFQGVGAASVQDPGPLATPLGASKAKTPRRSSILPLYKLNPASATKFVTPQKRGYGFSYSTFGTPTSPSSVASTPGGLGQSLLAGSINRGLGKSISSSNLRRSFNVEDSILAPGAFSASSGPRHYGTTGSIKKLVINRDVRSDLFSTPNKDKTAEDGVNGTRKLTKRVSFDTTSVPAAENGIQEEGGQLPDGSSGGQDMGFLRPSTRTPNGVNGTKPSSSSATPEMEQAKGKELAIVHEEGSPAAQAESSERAATKGRELGDYWMQPSKEEINNMNRVQRQEVPNFTVGRRGVGQIRFRVPVDLNNINVDDIPNGIVQLETRSATVYPNAALKPLVGKGLNVPAEITLENSWPRGRPQEKSGPRVAKHVERLKAIENTTFINYDPDTGVWTFAVEHFTTYGLDYDEEETDADVTTATDRMTVDEATPRAAGLAFSTSADLDNDDDTFDFKRKRRQLPGAFDEQEVSEEEVEDNTSQQQSFLSNRSADFGSLAVVPVTAEDEDMGQEGNLSENEDVATSSPRQYLPVERQDSSPYMGPGAQVQETPAGIMRARMRAIKESTTPMKVRVADGDDWAEMLQKTISPQKRDRVALKALNATNADQPLDQSYMGKAPASRSRIVSDGRGFATSIDLMNSLFEKAKAPVQTQQPIVPAKGFVKWPYKRQNKNPDDEASMDPTERAFHHSFKPSWAADGVCIYGTAKLRRDLMGSLTDSPTSSLAMVNVFAPTDASAEDPLDGIVDHRDLVTVELVHGVPSVSTRHVPGIQAFTSFRDNAHKRRQGTMSPLSKGLGAYELLVWELASVLFDRIDGVSSAAEESRLRREKLSIFWEKLVREASVKAANVAPSPEEKAVANLAGHQVSDACGALVEGKDFKTATLVSLIGTSDSFKRDMREQVEDWHSGDVLSEFTVPLRTIYSLLAGNVTVCQGKKGAGVENHMGSEIISERFGLDWKQAFGLRLWYGISAEDDIGAAVEKYTEDIEQGKVPAPRPWYMEQGIQATWTDPHADQREDLMFGLLKVFAGQARLEDVLQPANSQVAPFNFRLCWQLGQALSGTDGAKVKLSRSSADALTCSYAAEVACYAKKGNWVAAIWVLLHLTDPDSRVRAVQDVLAHHAGSLFTREAKEANLYERLVDDLKIPPSWIWEAAALYWRNRQSYPLLEAQCLLRASAFADAHKIFAKELAPKAIIERNYGEISSMLANFQPHRHAIPDWNLGGEVYGNFIELLAHRKRGQVAPSGVVEGLMASLPAMYEKAGAETGNSSIVEVAAITEMADVVAKEAMALANDGRMDLSKISRLPLTEDRRLRYSTDLAFTYYREVMSARG